VRDTGQDLPAARQEMRDQLRISEVEHADLELLALAGILVSHIRLAQACTLNNRSHFLN